MKKQIFLIHGGDTFENYNDYLNFLMNFKIDFERYRSNTDDWKPGLGGMLGPDFEVIRPEMPNKRNARYEEWKIWFEKFIPYLNDEVILIGHSMGGAFLAKYLSENEFPKNILGVFLVAAVFDKDQQGYHLVTFTLPQKLDLQTNKIFLYHSKDDPIVSFEDMSRYKSKLPDAATREFANRGHFNQAEFPEIVEDIRKL